MDLRTYLSVIARNLLLIVICALLGLGAGIGLFVTTPPSYRSSVDFYVSTPVPASSNPQSSGQFAEARVNSYVLLLTSEQLATRVVDATGVRLTPQQVARRIEASSEINTVVVTARVIDTSAERSLEIARGLAKTFPKLVDELDNSGRSTDVVTINVISGPNLLASPVAPSRIFYLGAGLGAGLLIGLLIAILRELFNTSVRTAEVARDLLNAPVLGTINYDRDARRAPLIIGSEATSRRAEAFRQLRTNLEFIDVGRSSDVILVTSAAPAEGKSTVAVNLALAFIEFGERVLLIDADLRKPRLGHLLDLPNGVGLTNVLTSHVKLSTSIQQWGDSSGYFLASGTTPANPSEVLGSSRMHLLIQQLRESYDKIVIDSPPVLPVADAAVTSKMVDAVLVVIQSGKTTRSQVSQTATALANVNAPVIGSVLNKTKVGRMESRYGRSNSPSSTFPVASK